LIIGSSWKLICISIHIIYLISEGLVFQGAGRGMVASESIGGGDIALEIPESLIISDELLCQSEVVCSPLVI